MDPTRACPLSGDFPDPGILTKGSSSHSVPPLTPASLQRRHPPLDVCCWCSCVRRYARAQKDDSPLYVFDTNFVNNPQGRQMRREYSVPELFPEDLFSCMGNYRPPFRCLRKKSVVRLILQWQGTAETIIAPRLFFIVGVFRYTCAEFRYRRLVHHSCTVVIFVEFVLSFTPMPRTGAPSHHNYLCGDRIRATSTVTVRNVYSS